MSRRPARSRPPSRNAARTVPPRSLELVIEEIGGRGDGVALFEGKRVFVPFTVPGDRVRAHLEAPRGEGIAARLEAVLEPGPGRGEPACRHFGTCGGCTLQHLNEPAYAAWKLDQVRSALARAGLDEGGLAPLARTPVGGRRRATFTALRRGGRVRLGFNERLSHRLADLEECPVLDPALVALVPRLRSVLATVMTGDGTLDIAATRSDTGLDVLLTGALALDLDARERLAGFAEQADLARLSWRASEKTRPEPIAHRRPVTVLLGGVTVPLPPGAFRQASTEGEAALTGAVLAGLPPATRQVADLFAGSGTFTLPLATRAAVHAVEGDAVALAALARAGHGRRVTTERRDLFTDPLSAKELARFDAVVFDPPRAGAAAQTAALAASGVPVVIGVSCNPATFARDARTLADGGYRLERVTPVDQFLWSAHMELVGTFRR